MESNSEDFGMLLEQNRFIHNLWNSKEIMERVELERIQKKNTKAFTKAQFLNTISQITMEV